MFLLLGLVIAGLLAVGLFAGVGVGRGGGAAPHAGSPVPAFSLHALEGTGQVGVPADGGGGGRPAVLLFFASWCTPCQAEIPALAAAWKGQRQSHSRLGQVALVGVDGADPTSHGRSFVKQAGVTFPVGADPTYDVTQGQFQFAGLPEAVFVRGDGTIAGIHLGALSVSSFVSWERRLLASA